ncbi:DUF4652 domain-containing protein [Chungangia koreensis]|uniref:DUF4652 domain-containing protein n=1 Tax=Chungangia koreensis TaxID=752657 RepID=A0ABV8X7N3_9LACT
MRKLMLLLFSAFLLAACGTEGGQKSGTEKIDVVEKKEEKVEKTPLIKGFITINGTEHELILNEDNLEGIPLSEFAQQLTPIRVNPEEKVMIHIDNDPYITVHYGAEKVPVESDSFNVPYETGSYIFTIKAQWPNEEATYITVLEVPYQFKRVERETEPNDPNPWIPSPNGDKEVLLEGYGEFESVGTIVLKNVSNNTFENIELNGRQWTPKQIEWFDNDSLLMIIGYTYGTVTRGGDVYHLNLDTLELTPVIELSDREEVADFKIEGNQLIYDVFMHDEDYNDGHKETRTFDLTTISDI